MILILLMLSANLRYGSLSTNWLIHYPLIWSSLRLGIRGYWLQGGIVSLSVCSLDGFLCWCEIGDQPISSKSRKTFDSLCFMLNTIPLNNRLEFLSKIQGQSDNAVELGQRITREPKRADYARAHRNAKVGKRFCKEALLRVELKKNFSKSARDSINRLVMTTRYKVKLFLRLQESLTL